MFWQRQWRWRGLVLLAFVTLTASDAGQGTVDLSDDKAKVVVQQAWLALGGEHFENMHSRSSTGRIYSFFRDQTVGSDIAKIYTEYLPEAPKEGVAIRERQFLGKKLDYSYLYLENRAWDITFRGARPLEDEQWQRYVRTMQNDILYFLKYRYHEPGLYFDFIGSEVYISRHVEIVDITDSERRTIRVYFDHNTHLPIRETFSWLDPDSKYKNDEILEYDKYRDIGAGVMWPFTVERSRNGYKSFQMFANAVEADGNVPANAFELPAKSKMLSR